MSPTRIALLNESETRLAYVDSPRLSAELLMAEVLGCSRLDLVLERDHLVPVEDVERIKTLVERRALGEPVAYILGKEFYGWGTRKFPGRISRPAASWPRPDND